MSEPTPPLPPRYAAGAPVWFVRPPRRRYWLHVLLFLATLFTTLVVGSKLQFNFNHHLPAYASDADLFPLRWALERPAHLLLGVPFSFSLMLILLAHEMGHFVVAARNGVYATLPYFIPAPTLIGTLGAFIRIRSPIRSRQALFDIGIAGPIAGFAVALPVLLLALALSRPVPAGAAQPEIQFGFPLIFEMLHRLTGSQLPLAQMQLHPVGVAAWVGMFATALNLLPGGQLDGGHIVYALWPRAHRTISRLTVMVLVPMGVYFWAGWLIWAALLAGSGMRHPQIVPAYASVFGGSAEPWPELGRTRRALALLGLLILIVTLMPAPFPESGLRWVWK